MKLIDVTELTPAQHAQKALDSIRAHPDSFNMVCWVFWDLDDDSRHWLEPNAEISCGTTMCVAG